MEGVMSGAWTDRVSEFGIATSPTTMAIYDRWLTDDEIKRLRGDLEAEPPVPPCDPREIGGLVRLWDAGSAEAVDRGDDGYSITVTCTEQVSRPRQHLGDPQSSAEEDPVDGAAVGLGQRPDQHDDRSDPQ